MKMCVDAIKNNWKERTQDDAQKHGCEREKSQFADAAVARTVVTTEMQPAVADVDVVRDSELWQLMEIPSGAQEESIC